MPRRSKSSSVPSTPSYRHQKASNQAFVELHGKRMYLGRHDLPESRQRYHRVLAEWEAGGRQPLINSSNAARNQKAAYQLSIGELVLRHRRHCMEYYRRTDGTVGTEPDNFRQALRPLVKLYADLPAEQFGPLALKAVRNEMIQRGWCRPHINHQVQRVRAVFRWAAAEELLPVTVYHQLQTVAALRKNRSRAPEGRKVEPVPPDRIEAIQDVVSPVVWAMIQVQLLSGARPDEVTRLTPGCIQFEDEVWTARLVAHKTDEHEFIGDRLIYLGPAAQSIIKPFLENRDDDAFLFSPKEAEELRRAQVHRQRKTPLSCGTSIGTNRVAKPRRVPGDRYTTASYRRAIHRACDQVFPPPERCRRKKIPAQRGGQRWETKKEWEKRLGSHAWAELKAHQKAHRWSPNRLRHNAASHLRAEYGIDVAQTVLGHRLGSVITEIYAEPNMAAARAAIAKSG